MKNTSWMDYNWVSAYPAPGGSPVGGTDSRKDLHCDLVGNLRKTGGECELKKYSSLSLSITLNYLYDVMQYSMVFNK